MHRWAHLLATASMVTAGLTTGFSASPASAASGGHHGQSGQSGAGVHSSPGAVPIYLNRSYSPTERAADLVSRMTLAEKAQQMDSSRAPAIPRLGVAAWGWWNESNHGVNAETTTASGNATTLTNTTSYPSDLSLGSTWNPGLVYQEAGLIGDEARDVVPGHTENLDFYAPTVNLTRDPRWGRNDESWSEDPTLTADLASQYVDGLQGQTPSGQPLPGSKGYYKAIATLKHYAANNSEVNRRQGSADMDQRTLREYYTAQFASIIQQSHPGSIMSSYNEVNGTPAPASVQLIDTMARETFGFTGYFTSDCDAVEVMQNDHHWVPPGASSPVNQYSRSAYAISAGEDLDCNAGYSDQYNYGNTVPTAIGQHIATQTDVFNVGDVDTSVVRLFAARIATGEFDDENQVPWVRAARARMGDTTWVSSDANNAVTETPQRLATAHKVADQSIVMLKNDPVGTGRNASSLLPLRVPHHGAYKIAVVGYYAHPSGGLYLGGYSSVQGPSGQAKEVDTYQGLKSAVQAIDPQAQVDFLPGVTGGTSAASLTTVDQATLDALPGYDDVVVVAGTDSGTSAEDNDRETLDLPGAQAQLISAAEAANPHTIVYLETVGDVTLSPFQSTTPALLWSSYNGERQGDAIADVLLGKVNPSGHLPFTWYADQSQIPAITDYNIRPTATTDGRTYQYFTGEVAYPFGYGQSYTRFAYSHLQTDRGPVDANGTLRVSAQVRNVGTTTGSTVAQLYATTPFEPASAQRPAKRLEAFQKVTLRPGQSTIVHFSVKASKLAFWDESANTYVVDPGRYGLQVGDSSADTALQGTVYVGGRLAETPTVLNAKPIQAGDTAAQVAQRVMFDAGTTIDPQLTVSMSDQKLYGYVTKGQSTPLPAGLSVSYRTDNPRVVSVNHGLRTVDSGIATVTATVRYHGASASTSFVVDVAPLQFTSSPSAVLQAGQAGSYTVTTSAQPTAHLSVTGTLPAGVTFTDNGDGTATIAGTPPATTGTYHLTITATNGVSPTQRQAFTLYVGTPPAITSSGNPVLVVGQQASYSVTTSGFPAPTVTESGSLPTGVTFTDNGDGTATIAGTPAAGSAGSYALTLTASNGLTPATRTTTLTVLAKAPAAGSSVLAGAANATFSFGGAPVVFPLAGITVHLYDAGTTTDAVPAQTTSASGGYEFDDVTPGSYQVEFVDPSRTWSTQWWNGAATQAAATTVTLTAGQATVGINGSLTFRSGASAATQSKVRAQARALITAQ